MRVLLTNDDGIEAAGLQALRRALLAVPGIQLAVIAPDGNRSANGTVDHNPPAVVGGGGRF
ncbi:MAG: 5'/3'-nucleotidase SurE [Solirubrobacteraceae bacterium]